ncbi:MAG: right-handed parallel beta-helix repeat-containing protein [Bacteroidia bacterium]
MKRILIALIILAVKGSAQTIISGGAVYGTWTMAGSPYLIQASVGIPNDSTLTIQPGVTVNFQGHYKILVLGRLIAEGTAIDSIYFTASNTSTGWYGIRFDNTTANNDTSRLSYCSVRWGIANGTGNDQYGGGLMFSNFSKVNVTNSLIKNCQPWGIYCTDASPRFYNNNISNCGNGGFLLTNTSNPPIIGNAISYNNGNGVSGSTNVTIINNNISHNSGTGIIATNGTISNNTISYNSSNAMAGGIYIGYQGTAQISKNIISYNVCSSSSYGGGIFCYIDYCTVTDNIITNNSCPTGAGIRIGAGGPTISNNLIANNSATTSPSDCGGGIAYGTNTTDVPTIINNTIVNNSASNGGGIYFSGTTTVSITNCIVYGNTAAVDGSEIYLQTQASQPNFYYCDVEGGVGAFGLNGNVYLGTYSNCINSNPQFTSPTAGSGTVYNGYTADWTLQNTSPCINSGKPSGPYPSSDLAGNPRVSGPAIDIGAYEYQSTTGITTDQSPEKMLVYPNPSYESVTIQSVDELATITIYNAIGQVVLQTKSKRTTEQINISQLLPGIYTVCTQAGCSKLIKK